MLFLSLEHQNQSAFKKVKILKNLWILIGAILFFSVPSLANENMAAHVIDNTQATDENAPIEFIESKADNKVEIDADIPTCDDSVLISKVWTNGKSFMAKNPPSSIIEKRRQNLISKNLDKFQEIPAGNITAKDDFNVASKVIMIKINNGLDGSKLRLCKSTSKGITANVYILIYKEYGRINVDVINFSPLANQNNEFSFKYWQ